MKNTFQSRISHMPRFQTFLTSLEYLFPNYEDVNHGKLKQGREEEN